MTWLQSLTMVDYVILAVMALALLIGWVKGLVEVLTGFLVFVIATVVAGQYTDNLVAWLNSTWHLQDKLAAAISRQLHLPAEASKVHMGSIPWQKALEWLQSVPIPETYRTTLAHRLSSWSAAAGNETAASFITNQLAGGVLNTVVFLIFATILGSALGVLGALISDRIKELPLVGTANSMLGSAVIGFEAAAIVAFALGLVVPLVSMYGPGSLGHANDSAKLPPYFLNFYGWLRAIVFGLTQGTFFAS